MTASCSFCHRRTDSLKLVTLKGRDYLACSVDQQRFPRPTKTKQNPNMQMIEDMEEQYDSR